MHLVSRAMKAAGLSQTTLARYLGLRPQQLSRWIKGGKMDAAAVSLFLVIEREPVTTMRALAQVRGLPALDETGGSGRVVAGRALSSALRELARLDTAAGTQLDATILAYNTFNKALHPKEVAPDHAKPGPTSA